MNDDLNTGLNGNMRDFFADDGSSAKTPILGGFGALILHLVVIALAPSKVRPRRNRGRARLVNGEIHV